MQPLDSLAGPSAPSKLIALVLSIEPGRVSLIGGRKKYLRMYPFSKSAAPAAALNVREPSATKYLNLPARGTLPTRLGPGTFSSRAPPH